MTNHPPPPTHAGQAVYSRLTLAVYDFWVLGLSNRFIWRCPTKRLRRLYDEHVSAEHLDVGVGTGYFLDNCRFPDDEVRLGLLDLNRNSLQTTARRVRRYRPQSFPADILAPLELETAPFRSIGLNYLLHCLPGSLLNKATALDHLDPYLAPGGRLFGSTLLGQGVPRTAAARRLMAVYNKRGIFSNTADSLEELEVVLDSRYSEYGIEVQGCAALFWANKY